MKSRLEQGCIFWESSEELQAVFDTLFDGLVIIREDTKEFVFANQTICKMLGYSKDELLSKSIEDMHSQDDLPHVLDEFKRATENPHVLISDVPFLCKDGNVIFADITSSPKKTVFKGHSCQMGFVRDVSARKLWEKTLREREETLNSIFRAAPAGIGLVKSRVFEWVNDRLCEMVGYTSDELSGQSVRMIYPNKEEFLRVGREKYAQIEKEGKGSLETSWKCKDGSIVGILLSSTPMDSSDFSKGIIFTALDISELRNVEKERESLIRKLEVRKSELERFIYMLSHDLKSPLFTIRGYLQFIDEDLLKGNIDKVKISLSHISKATHHMEELIRDVLELFRVGWQAQGLEEMTLRDLVEDAIEIVSGVITKKSAEVMILDGSQKIYGDRARLVEVYQNLIENAVMNMGSQTEPIVEIGGQSIGGENVFFVRDNGKGIEPIFHEKIFELFEKLDRVSDGSGVGLALVKRIIEVHGGRIWVESEGEGKGTVFYFILPSP